MARQNENGELKRRAWLAKQRLKMGYWNSLHGSVNDGEPVPQSKSYVSDNTLSKRDETMYKKVCAMLESDETTLNPIGQLIDNDEYSKLDAQSKQRYILELSKKFRELKERYYTERKTGS